MSKHFKLRSYHRVIAHSSGYYLSEDFLGKCTVWDMSSGGWRMEGDHQVKVGMILTLRINLSDAKMPVEVDQAIVQWVSGRTFGVQIKTIRRSEAMRLRHLIGSRAYTFHKLRD